MNSGVFKYIYIYIYLFVESGSSHEIKIQKKKHATATLTMINNYAVIVSSMLACLRAFPLMSFPSIADQTQ